MESVNCGVRLSQNPADTLFVFFTLISLFLGHGTFHRMLYFMASFVVFSSRMMEACLVATEYKLIMAMT